MAKKLYIDYPIWVPRGEKPAGYVEYLKKFPHTFDGDPYATEEAKWRYVAQILVRRKQEDNIRYVEEMFR